MRKEQIMEAMNELNPKPQQSVLVNQSPPPQFAVKEWDEDSAKYALDDLFNATRRYKSSDAYRKFLKFVGRFRFYSSFNSFLIYLQRPGAGFVAPPTRWKKKYQRILKPNATPIVILQPNGPVMFVFDVSDTDPLPGARPLPPEVLNPFMPRGGKIGSELERTKENAKRDGIRILPQLAGTQSAGSIRWTTDPNAKPLMFYTGKDKQGLQKYQEVKVKFDLLVNQSLSPETEYVAISHELAHLYCGHIGTPNKKWWPDRWGMSEEVAEFEAESAAYIVCSKIGLQLSSDSYLYQYLKSNDEIPEISLERVMKAAGTIESMGKQRLKPRKKD
jgi:hypothetical protein